MAKFKGTLSIGFPTAERHFNFEIDDDEFEGLSEEEKQTLIDKTAWDCIECHGYIEYYAEEVS